ncbi:hypothetical protein D3C76_969680 [compost metagenome]
MQHARTDGVVAQAVDDDEAAGIAVFGIGIEGDSLVQAQVADADFVQLQGPGRQLLQGIDVDLVLQVRAGHAQGAAADFQQVRPPGQHGFLAHPHQGCFELIGNRQRRVDRGDNVATADVDFVFQGQGDRLAANGVLLLTCRGDD